MVTLLITSVFVLGLLAIAIYFWQKAANTSQTIELPLPPTPRACFPTSSLLSCRAQPRSEEGLLENAAKGDKNALAQAHA